MSGITAVELDELLGPAPIAVEDLDVVGPLPKPPKLPTKTFTAGPPQPPSVSVAGKRSPVTTEKLLRLVQYRSETPSAAEACRRAKINVSTLRYWLAQSIDGDPGDAYDIPLNGDRDDNGRPSNTIRFHEAWDDAFYLIEVKSEFGTQRPEQIEYEKRWSGLKGVVYEVVYSPDQIHATLDRLTGRTATLLQEAELHMYPVKKGLMLKVRRRK